MQFYSLVIAAAPSSHLCVHRDGGLKRAKVKEALKEEQQKLYSKVLVGELSQRDDKPEG